MGLLDFLKPKPREMTITATHVVSHNALSVHVVGESNYQDALWAVAGAPRGTEVRTKVFAVLVPEPQNSYDRNAVAVFVNNSNKVGYLSRDDAAAYQPILRRHRQLVACDALIAGGGPGDDGRMRMLGIFLELPEPEELARDLRR